MVGVYVLCRVCYVSHVMFFIDPAFEMTYIVSGGALNSTP